MTAALSQCPGQGDFYRCLNIPSGNHSVNRAELSHVILATAYVLAVCACLVLNNSMYSHGMRVILYSNHPAIVNTKTVVEHCTYKHDKILNKVMVSA